ncbi:uncharacterized protein LOC143082581 [Mytilus galloprovincialis]|uniref:uncharacterized protein LOC143082581 n=1 Tax=Mytilus galloprovincialis TaxID=29158 RepID=UPI003F7BD227
MMITILTLASLFTSIYGHGRLILPPGRSTMWRLGYNTPKNYNDNQVSCGGFYKQWTLNKGKCGLCGDPWDGTRENEAGGKYATGTIAGNYSAGNTMEVKLEITASHKGFHEFRICPVNNPSVRATQSCFDAHILHQPNGQTKFDEPGAVGTYAVTLVLPRDVSCTQCVLQWIWNTGNSYGCDQNNKCCIGCGPQEQFYGCADIAISPASGYSATDNNNHATSYHVQNFALCLIYILVIQILINNLYF